MERAISRQPTRKVCKVPALTKMPLATQKEDIGPTKTQLASKAATKEEQDNRPKLMPLHNRVNQRTNIPSKIPTMRPLAATKPPSLLQTKASDLPKRYRVTVTDRERDKVAKKELCHTTEVDGMKGDLELIDTTTDKETDSTARRGGTKTTHLSASIGDGKQPDDRAVVCRIVPSEHQQKHKYFHSLQPDHITDSDALPELDSRELNDPQQCTEYIRDIYENLLMAEREQIYRTMPVMLNQQSEVKETHRRVLVDWLIQVHQKFNLLPDTLHICIDILDRYLQVQLLGYLNTTHSY